MQLNKNKLNIVKNFVFNNKKIYQNHQNEIY